MRIRSIRPEFWSSTDIADLDWHDRLVFIGLWQYVDDNAVGRDIEKLIVSALFPLDDDLTESSLRVHGALKRLETGGQVTRYTVDRKPYLHITGFGTHQVINRASKDRYPLPTCANAKTHTPLSEPSVSPQVDDALGEGEKGRRGEVKDLSSADALDVFDSFWELYPKKEAKGAAAKAFKAASKKIDPNSIVLALKAQLPVLAKTERQFIPLAGTWLNAERWADEAPPAEPEVSMNWWENQ